MTEQKVVPRNLALGQAGVFRVQSELLLRGVNSWQPAVDIGADLMLSDGRRVQVKAARLLTRTYVGKNAIMGGPGYRWSFNSAKGTYFIGGMRRNPNRSYGLRKFSEEVDFMVFWGVDEDRFWILPAASCDLRSSLLIRPRLIPPDVASWPGGTLAALALQHEGRWDLLLPAPEPQLQLVVREEAKG